MRISQPGPEGQTPPAARWRWLLPLGVTAVIFTLLALPLVAAPGMVLSYSRFMSDVGAGTVRAVTIDPAGQVIGRLASGREFATMIPVAIDDRALAGRLAAHNVQVTGIAAATRQSGEDIGSDLRAATTVSRPYALARRSPDPGDEGSPASARNCFHGPSARLERDPDPGPPRPTLLSAFPALVPQRGGADTVSTGLLDRRHCMASWPRSRRQPRPRRGPPAHTTQHSPESGDGRSP